MPISFFGGCNIKDSKKMPCLEDVPMVAAGGSGDLEVDRVLWRNPGAE